MIQGIQIDKKTIEKMKEIVKAYYKNDEGEPFVLTEGQAIIFATIFKKLHHRVHIEAFTRYGKSETIAMAVLTRISIYPERFAIVAGQKDKANIIMSNIIKHIFDNDNLRKKFVLDPGESEESIRRYRNKSKINLRLKNNLLGEVYICTAQGAMGFGAANIVEDESALISGKDHAFVARMLGDKTDNYLFKVGNPFESEHFKKSYEDPAYAKIVIDYKQGIDEGRITSEFVEEMKKQPFFDVLYECKFSDANMVDEQGYSRLIKESDVKQTVVVPFGELRMGVDVAEDGGDWNEIVLRWANYAKIALKYQSGDTMGLVGRIIQLATELNILDRNIFVDSIGIGKGVVDRLYEQGWKVNAVKVSEKAQDEFQFSNLRAENYWKLRAWIASGACLEPHEDWNQLTQIKYKVRDSTGKLLIIDKESMRKQGVGSPNGADALMLSFSRDSIINRDKIKTAEERATLREFDFYKNRKSLNRRI